LVSGLKPPTIFERQGQGWSFETNALTDSAAMRNRPERVIGQMQDMAIICAPIVR